jgi:hypothetical protein
VQRVVTLLWLLGIAFALYAVWRHGHAGGTRVLASWARTPGVVNPDVTQTTIGKTICVRGWTRMVRPPTEYTSELKVRQMAEYGLAGSPTGYQEDHLISLELGGHPTDPRNLWPEPRAHAEEVDKVENELNRKVCSGEISLDEGRRRESRLKHTSG